MSKYHSNDSSHMIYIYTVFDADPFHTHLGIYIYMNWYIINMAKTVHQESVMRPVFI
jgi:hypothetical protein